MSIAAGVHERLHQALVFDRRRDRLVGSVLGELPDGATVLDIGCGNGEIGALLGSAGHGVVGVEVHRRTVCAIPSCDIDGVRLPFADDAVDWALLVDVLHHAPDAESTLREAGRVARCGVIVKDHVARNGVDRFTLGVMDWVGNRQFGVGREGKYRSDEEWRELLDGVGLEPVAWDSDLDLYPGPAKPFFERSLHFVARLEPGSDRVVTG